MVGTNSINVLPFLLTIWMFPPQEPELLYEDRPPIKGEYAIQQFLRYLNRDVRTREHRLSDESFVDIHLPIAAVSSC